MTAGSPIRRAYVDAAGVQVHYRVAGPEGARSPLLLLHPSPSSGLVYEPFMAEMGKDRFVIAPDLPGHGMSGIPDSPPQITDYANIMLALEAKLGLGLFDVMGYHSGGLVAAEMARQQPAAVRKIVMISALLFTPEESGRIRDALKTMAGRGVDDRAGGFSQQWLNFKNNFWKMGDGDVRTWNLYLEAQRNPQISTWGQQAVVDYDLQSVLPTLTQPVLILNPDDELTAHTGRAAALVKNGKIHPLSGWTHGFLDSETAETARIVRAFLDS